MTSICTFPPTTKSRPLNHYIFFGHLNSSPFYGANSEIKVFNAVSSWCSNVHNSLQCLHNSNSSEDASSVEFSITVREDANMAKAQNLARLDQIAALEDNWNGYGAKAFPKELIDKCKDIINSLQLQPKIFPTGRQSIQFQYELEDRSYLEFEIRTEKISCLTVPKRKYSDAHSFEFSISESKKVREIVQKFYE